MLVAENADLLKLTGGGGGADFSDKDVTGISCEESIRALPKDKRSGFGDFTNLECARVEAGDALCACGIREVLNRPFARILTLSTASPRAAAASRAAVIVPGCRLW